MNPYLIRAGTQAGGENTSSCEIVGEHTAIQIEIASGLGAAVQQQNTAVDRGCASVTRGDVFPHGHKPCAIHGEAAGTSESQNVGTDPSSPEGHVTIGIDGDTRIYGKGLRSALDRIGAGVVAECNGTSGDVAAQADRSTCTAVADGGAIRSDAVPCDVGGTIPPLVGGGPCAGTIGLCGTGVIRIPEELSIR